MSTQEMIQQIISGALEVADFIEQRSLEQQFEDYQRQRTCRIIQATSQDLTAMQAAYSK